MRFDQLDERNKVNQVKAEFNKTIKELFEQPDKINDFIKNKHITSDEAKKVLKSLSEFNSYSCACCRSFDTAKLTKNVLADEFDFLIDYTLDKCKKINY